MLIKTQERDNNTYYNISVEQEMKVILTERLMGWSDFDEVLVYTITIKTDSNSEDVASYQSSQDAKAELERFKNAWMNGDEEFEFAADDELRRKLNDIKMRRKKELEQEIERRKKELEQEIERFKQEHEQRHKELFEEVKEQVEFDRALTKFFCYAATFLTYGAVIHLGVKYIKAPLPLAVTGILAGVIGAALVSYAKKQ